ncbi:c-type cytochrome [Deinococcus yavapaiensis]|uniref:Cytochrome c-type biogenesis protein CcmH/NrfG n=1 Tax=Deinococcus yavapaiensis KR-236 TaxID=694435 RepID=A0A318S9Q3_9DEIO|nr:c-type cytochrome [Deinococcus yavapaiensis]PYE55870.1 cytochrome c-type biogenesis protein CcmH/NrfG [Deinococcus yavapaiensis KR-236]
MILLVVALVVSIVAALIVVTGPLGKAAPETSATDEVRADLEEEYGVVLAAIRELDDAVERGEADEEAARKERLRLQGRAGRALSALEALPVTPKRPGVSPVRPGMVALVGAMALVAIGAFTFLPRWQLAGLGAGEQDALRSALDIPRLERAARSSKTLQAYMTLGRANFQAGRFEDAARAYADALRVDPRQAEALRRVGGVLLQDPDKLREAYQFIDLAARLEPNSDEGQLFLGFALARGGDVPGALKALERYRTLNPQGRDADELIATLRGADSAADLGRATYAASCASCHGTEGQGGVGPSLEESRLSEDAIKAVVRGGAAGMPAYDATELSNERLDALVKLLRSWQGGS